MPALTTIQAIGQVAQVALDTARAVKSLRTAGMGQAALKLEQECNRAVNGVVRTAARRRAAANKARKARR